MFDVQHLAEGLLRGQDPPRLSIRVPNNILMLLLLPSKEAPPRVAMYAVTAAAAIFILHVGVAMLLTLPS